MCVHVKSAERIQEWPADDSFLSLRDPAIAGRATHSLASRGDATLLHQFANHFAVIDRRDRPAAGLRNATFGSRPRTWKIV